MVSLQRLRNYDVSLRIFPGTKAMSGFVDNITRLIFLPTVLSMCMFVCHIDVCTIFTNTNHVYNLHTCVIISEEAVGYNQGAYILF